MFICNFVEALTSNQSKLYKMYKAEDRAFATLHFAKFKLLIEFQYKWIHVKWDIDMNESCQEVLALKVKEKRIPTRHNDQSVTKKVWAYFWAMSSLNVQVKSYCLLVCLLILYC